MTMFRALVLATMLVFVTAAASAQNGRSHETVEACETLTNPCCDEEVEICYTARYTLDRDGIPVHVTIHGGGIGSNGTKYVYNGTAKLTLNESENGASVSSSIQNVNLITTGNHGCTYSADFRIKVVINANGETVVDSEIVNVTCGGEDIE